MPVTVYAPELTEQLLSIDTAGGAGVAVGSGSFALRVRGKLKDISLNFNASAPATTDVIVSYDDHNGVTHNITISTSSEVDIGLPNIKQDTHDDAAAAISALFADIDFQKWTTINVSVAQCDALTAAVVVGLVMERGSRQRFWDGAYNP